MFEVSKITANLLCKEMTFICSYNITKIQSIEMKSNGGLVHFEWKAWVESVCNQKHAITFLGLGVILIN